MNKNRKPKKLPQSHRSKPKLPWAPPDNNPFKHHCFQCSGVIDASEEPCYTVSYEPSNLEAMNGKKTLTHFFHPSCFKQVAGKRFMFGEM